jgi:hypothetical protein
VGLLVLVVTAAVAHAADAPPRVFLHDAARLAEVQRLARAGDAALAPFAKLCRNEADKALERGPWSVMDKETTPPSGDKHDYMSLAPYWWPDPSKPDGLPFIRRDGEQHPDRNSLDYSPLRDMARAVSDLAMAWWVTAHEPYAARAALVLRRWFLDPATRMNPNLNFGQAIPGRVAGRGIGIIDTTALLDVVEGAGLLAGSEAWTDADQKALEAWFAAYLKWLVESPLGRDEAAQKNNHGTWYNVQVMAYALFARQDAAARAAIDDARRCVDTQIEPDGRQPLELARTKSWDYSAMNLRGMFDLATLAARLETDLWRWRPDGGGDLRAALDYMLPYAADGKKWPHKQITTFNPQRVADSLRRAALVYAQPRYEAACRRALADAKADWRLALWRPAAAETGK